MARPKRSVSGPDRMNAKKTDPLGYLCDRFLDPNTSDEEKMSIAKELLPYQVPKLKAVEMTTQSDVKVTISIGGTE